MVGLRKFVSDTAVYGLSSILSRFINYFLVPLYTLKLPSAGAYGVVTVLFSWCTFLNVILTFGMETTFFNFARKKDNPQSVFSAAFRWVAGLSFLFVVLVFAFDQEIMNWVGYSNHPEYARYFAIIIAADALVAIILSKVRYDERPFYFAFIRISNIAVNMGLNLFFILLCPWLIKAGYTWPSNFYSGQNLVEYIFISNLVASVFSFLLLLPSVRYVIKRPEKGLILEMLFYAGPLVIAGFAGMVNETMDRILLKKMLPDAIADTQVGIYGAFYKASLVITIFLQAYRYAIEPILFKSAGGGKDKGHLALAAKWFTYTCCVIFLGTLLFLPEFSHLFIRKKTYFDDPNGLAVVPILLVANVFLGMFFNAGMWYKINNQTHYGAGIAIVGALITIVGNVIFIPEYGFVACAWITLLAYGIMLILAYTYGQKHYPVPYEMNKIMPVLLLSLAGVACLQYFDFSRWWNALILLVILGLIFIFEKGGQNKHNQSFG
jgi:O-antigen/teichoic acid export membrane protein